MKPSPWKPSPWRIGCFLAAAALAILGIVARLVVVQIVHGEDFRRAARANQMRLIPIAAPRGTIFDRSGAVLVRNRPSFVVALIPSDVKDLNVELRELSQTIYIPQTALRKQLLRHGGVNYANFDEVQLYEPYGPVILASDLSVAQIARLAEKQASLPGVDLEAQPVRNYPMKAAGSHVFGYVGQITQSEYKALKRHGYSPNDVVGKDGLEAVYDSYLRGVAGGEQVEVDSQGQVSRHLARRESVPGNSLLLTIDARLQSIVERALANEVKLWGRGRRLSGAIVVEDPYTGGILAMASYPNFNPNDFANGIKPATFARYILDPMRPLYNRAIGAATPTGSTFKLVTGSGALSAPVVRVNEVVYDSGAWNCHGALFRDIAAGGLGSTTFIRALAASSDGYFYQMADRLGHKRLRFYALQYGLNAKSGIDLPGEYEGNWPTNAWSLKVTGLPLEPSDVCILGIGQGAMQATPLQMANIVSTVVNGGTLYRPHLVRAIRDPKGRIIKRFTNEKIRAVPVTKAALLAVRAGMSEVTDPGGTAYGLAIGGLPFGGKTGTVETEGGSGPNTTWFIAYAPADQPKLAMAVYMEKSGGYGAQVAAPIARQIMVEYFHKKP
ncbi:MAG: penicillin-binding protein 2 [Candidatus Eremiobacteraeota bacterium]|nr:penicillin-binding protein 2 [Candidatus Eremiobacteraeota bacterium]